MARRPLKTSAKPTVSAKKKAASSSGKGWIVALLLIALGGGGGYYAYDQHQQKEAAARRAAAEAARKAREKAERLKAEEEARMAAEKAERERLAREEEERRRLEEEERRRREAEEAERLRKKNEQQPEEVDEPTPEPVVDDTPSTPKEPGLYDEPLPLHGPDANTATMRKKFDELIDKVIDKQDFSAFEREFGKRIIEAIPTFAGNTKLNYAMYKNQRNLIQAVDLCLLVRKAGPEALNKLAATEGNANDNNGRDFIRWALRDKSRPLHLFMQSYLTQEGRDENMAHSLELFYNIWAATEDKERVKYLNLTIAGALMNPQVCDSNGRYRSQSEPILTVPEVCAFLREMDKKRGALLTDIKKLNVSQLIYVVDARLPRNEFDWAIENVNFTQANWGGAYSSVRYLMERATNGKDPYTDYSFAEILKEGGICMDQAYYACNTGKCRGIPTAYVTGDGDRGPHAWMVNLVDATNWVQTNSYGYNSGRFSNPCSGRVQHESVLLNQSAKTTDAKLAPAADAMILGDYLVRAGATKESHNTARYVTEAFPELTASWAHYIKVLGHDEKNLPPTSVWRKVDTDLNRLSRKNSELLDLAAEVQEKYLLAGRNAASKQAAMNRAMSQLKRRGGDDRADLVLAAVERQAQVMAEAGNMRGLANLYRKQLKEYTKRGDIFEQLLRQYMGFLGEKATPRDWNTLARDTEKLFDKHVLSGGGDFFKLKKEVAIQHMIANAWENAGNTRKAEKLHAIADERLKKGQQQHGGGED